MTSRNCQNCGQAIGPSEQSYSYLGRVICKTCKASFEKQFQALMGTDGPIETETPKTDEQIDKGTSTRRETPIQENQLTTAPLQQIETERPIAEATIAQNTNKKNKTEHKKPLLEKKASPLPSHNSLSQSEDVLAPQSPNNALPVSEQQKLPRWCRPKRKVLWFWIGILVLMGLLIAVFIYYSSEGAKDDVELYRKAKAAENC